MKIGVITIEQVGNYGAELQCYATQKVLQNIGCDAEIIDYCYYKDYRYKDSKMSEPFVPMTFKERIFYVLKYRIVNRFVDKVLLLFNSNIARRNSRFAAFHAENTKMSRKYMSMPELYEASMDYDIFVTGSDQVWNPGAQSSIEPYFLTFAPDSARKISFAASFGVSEIEPNLRERYKEYLSRYDFISVREQNACDMVKQLVGKDAECVLDPTLLLTKDEWMKVARQYDSVPEHYVLVYTLFESPAIFSLAKKVAKEKGISVLRITKRAYFVSHIEGISNISDAGPAEFISLIAGADYIITDSFHGTAFSVNFGIPFSTVVSSKNKSNSRMDSLLNIVGLRERLITDDSDMDSVKYELPIDEKKVSLRVEAARNKSIDFLKGAIC